MNGLGFTLCAVGVLVAAGALRAHGSPNTHEETAYHLTDRARFVLDPRFAPADNTIALQDRSGRPGLYLAPRIEGWVQGHGYWRPFVVEFGVDPQLIDDPGVHGRWGGERFVPAASFGRLTLRRVIPLDAYIREQYRDHGWIESALGRTFDTGEPIVTPGWNAPRARPFPDGYRYPGPDVRTMPMAEVRRLKADLKRALPILRS